jgi:hypothetical protein
MRYFKIYVAVLLSFGFYSCLEEIDLKTEQEFESVLVVESTITDNLSTQLVLLSKTYPLGENEPLPELNAQVRVLGDDGNTFSFQETEAGRYESVLPFAAQDGVNYKLNIIRNNGEAYFSENSTISGISQIDDLYVNRDFNENDLEGVSIYLDSSDPTARAQFYRYTYEETYKIIAPKYSPLDLEYEYLYNNPDFPNEITGINYFLVTKPEQQQDCYNTVASNDIILGNTSSLTQENLEGFRVRFLSRFNTIITHRYSILVNQYVQSAEAYAYYETLKSLSDGGDVLLQQQPGFVSGNIFSVDDPDRNIVGYFEVASLAKRRIYFNYSDLFPGEILPPYFQSCTPFAPEEVRMGPTFPLVDALEAGNKYFEPNNDMVSGEGAYDMVSPICGNCTIMGNNYPPDFWEE